MKFPITPETQSIQGKGLQVSRVSLKACSHPVFISAHAHDGRHKADLFVQSVELAELEAEFKILELFK